MFTPSSNASTTRDIAASGFRSTDTRSISSRAIHKDAFEPNLTTEMHLPREGTILTENDDRSVHPERETNSTEKESAPSEPALVSDEK